MPTDFHSSRCRVSSISRTIGLLRTSFLMAYSNASGMRHRYSFCRAELRAARARVSVDLGPCRPDRLPRQDPDPDVAAVLERSKGVLDDPILERMKTDDHEPRALPQTPRRRFDEPIEP